MCMAKGLSSARSPTLHGCLGFITLLFDLTDLPLVDIAEESVHHAGGISVYLRHVPFFFICRHEFWSQVFTP
jgi:hypothetical protein